MIALIKLDYQSKNEFLKKATQEEWESLREDRPYLGMDAWTDPEKKPVYWYSSDDTLIDLQTDGVELSRRGISFTVKRFKGTYIAAAGESGGNQYHLHVAIPNIALLSYNRVLLLDDACTDELQRHLDNGWRIIAVCPPNSVRRPDYILGRAE